MRIDIIGVYDIDIAVEGDSIKLGRDRVQQMKSQGSSVMDVEKKLEPEVRAKYKDWDNPNWIKNAIDNFYNRAK